MRSRPILLAALLAAVPAGTHAQQVQAVVQVGNNVTPVTVTQGSSQNFVGVIQIGPAPSASIAQVGSFNFAGVAQAGITTQSLVSQMGAWNAANIRQAGWSNMSSVQQLGR